MATCYSNQLDAQLKQGLPAIVLLWGDDAGAIRQGAEAVVAASGVDPADAFLAEKLTLADLAATPSRLTDAALTIAFGGGTRLIQLVGVSGDEPASPVNALIDAVKALTEMPLADVVIVLPVPKLLDKTSPLVKLLEPHPQALVVRFYLPTARDIAQWLQSEFQAAGKRVDPEAMAFLSDHLGADREQARREVEKLLLYVAEAESVGVEDVLASLAGAIPADAFRLAEAVGRRDLRNTDRLIRCLQEEGEDLSAAFSMTLRHLNLLKAAQTNRKDGQPDEAILRTSGKGGAPRQAKEDFLRQVNTYPAGRLATLPAYALETLSSARGGVMSADLVLARALLALAA